MTLTGFFKLTYYSSLIFLYILHYSPPPSPLPPPFLPHVRWALHGVQGGTGLNNHNLSEEEEAAADAQAKLLLEELDRQVLYI